MSAEPTCADMGPLLRGPMDDEVEEGPRKEASIIAACERDKWPKAVLACAAGATEPTVQGCLDLLPPETRALYAKALEKFGSSSDEHDPPPAPEPTTCAAAFDSTAIDVWPPAVATEAERSLASKLRGAPLRTLCEDRQWELALRDCIASTPAARIDDCLARLGDAQRLEVERTIEEADKVRAKIVKVRVKPANITCEKVVASHYANAKWSGKAPELKGGDRSKAIAASRKAMLSSCKMSWSRDVRACIVADDSDACYALAGLDPRSWGYPATSRLKRSGIAECDEYALAVEALASCSVVPQETRQAMLDAYDQAADAWAALPPSELEAAKTACKAAADATRHAVAACT